MHTLTFLAPGHFHAVLTLGERHPCVRDEIFIYIYCAVGSWGARRPRMGGYVTGTGATRGETAAGGR